MSLRRAARDEAQRQFVREGRTVEQIASACGLSKSTVSKWCAAGKWMDRRQEVLRESPMATVEKLKARRATIIQNMSANPNDDAALEDRLLKLTQAIDRMERAGESIGTTLDVMERFARYVAAHCTAETADLLRAATESFLEQERKTHD